jgi:hypothetical protein
MHPEKLLLNYFLKKITFIHFYKFIFSARFIARHLSTFLWNKIPESPYMIVHHGHSPGVMELNSIQFGHRQEVALSGKS